MTTDLHVFTGVYACDAQPAEERSAVREHLRDCDPCAAEARSLLETTGLLGLAAAATPPPDLRTRVLAAVVTTPQLLRAAEPTGDLRAQTRARRSGSPPRWALAAAASLAVLTIAVGATAVRSLDQAPDGDPVQASARTVSVTTGQASATVTLTRDDTQLSFTSRGLPDPATGRTYQLWLIDDDTARSAGTFSPSGGPERARIISNPGRAQTLTVTEEPAGGSARPTSKPVLVLNLPPA